MPCEIRGRRAVQEQRSEAHRHAVDNLADGGKHVPFFGVVALLVFFFVSPAIAGKLWSLHAANGVIFLASGTPRRSGRGHGRSTDCAGTRKAAMLGIPMKHRAPRVDILYSTAADGAPDEKSSTLRKKLMPLSIEKDALGRVPGDTRD